MKLVHDFLPNWMIFFHLLSTWLSDLYITKNCVFCWYTTAEKQKFDFFQSLNHVDVNLNQEQSLYLKNHTVLLNFLLFFRWNPLSTLAISVVKPSLSISLTINICFIIVMINPIPVHNVGELSWFCRVDNSLKARPHCEQE